ncbi:Hypothetical predicted protein, partial [Marmota monax]
MAMPVVRITQDGNKGVPRWRWLLSEMGCQGVVRAAVSGLCPLSPGSISVLKRTKATVAASQHGGNQGSPRLVDGSSSLGSCVGADAVDPAWARWPGVLHG